MKIPQHFHLKTLILLLFSAVCVHAGAYLKLGDIEGESEDSRHKGWIDVLSVDWKISVDPGTGSSRRGDPKVGPLTLTKRIDQASPKIQEAMLTGIIVPLVEYELTTGGDGAPTYLRIEMKNVALTAYSMSGHTTDPATGLETRPEEEFSMSFEEITVTYTPIDKDGSPGTPVKYTWKVEEGEG